MRNRIAEGPVRMGLMAIVMLALAGSAARAEILKGELIVTPKLSLGLPIGDYPVGELKGLINIQPGFAFGVLVDKVATEHLAFGGELHYNVNKVDASKISDALSPGDRDKYSPKFEWRTIQVTGHARYYFNPAASVNFFAHVGGGVYLNKFAQNAELTGTHGARVTERTSSTTTGFGFNTGPGLLVRLSPSVRLSAEALFNNVFTQTHATRFVNFTLGLVFRIPTQ